jgi:hypothetical protein
MAPVTGGIPDAEEDRFVFPAGFFERGFPPRIPVYRITGVLKEVRGIFVRELIGHSVLPFYTFLLS